MRVSMLLPALALLAVAAAPGVSHAQLAPDDRPIPSNSWVYGSKAPPQVAPPPEEKASGKPAEVPLEEESVVQLVRTMAGNESMKTTFGVCDTSEMRIGTGGGTTVTGNVIFANVSGGGDCPETGKSFTPPPGINPPPSIFEQPGDE